MRKVLLLTWYDAAWHPATVFTAQMLSERGDEVALLYRRPNQQRVIPGATDYGVNVRLYPSGQGFSGWRNQVAYLAFVWQAVQLVRKWQPDVIVGYDMHGVTAAYFARQAYRLAKLIYHNFDLASFDELRMYGRLVKMIESIAARTADLTVLSSPGRAEIFRQEARLQTTPLVMLNCQRRVALELQTGELQEILQQHNLKFERLVIRLGSLGPGHSIEATIRSLPFWQGNWGLILVGMGSEEYLIQLRSLMQDMDLGRKVLILPAVSYSLWYDCLYAADVGIALYEQGNINHASMAGAGNKLNLYLKAGIPSILPAFVDFVAFLQRYAAGLVVCPTDPRSIAAAINQILGDDQTYQYMCQQARRAFEEEYNFEHQFKPIMDWLNTHA